MPTLTATDATAGPTKPMSAYRATHRTALSTTAASETTMSVLVRPAALRMRDRLANLTMVVTR